MSQKSAIEDFIVQRTFALIGMSRQGKKFGNAIYNELTAKGYRIFPVHKEAADLGGIACSPSLQALPEPVDGLIISVAPAKALELVQEAHKAGIRRIWIQQGSETLDAIAFCSANGISAVYGKCILMFTENVRSVHAVHRFIKKITGSLYR